MWRGSKNTQKLWWDFLLEVKRIDRGKSLWFSERELSTLWSYLILWPLLSKAILHTREAASVLSKSFRPYPIFLCSRQLLIAGSAAVSEDFSQSHRGRLCLCIWQSWSPSGGKCPDSPQPRVLVWVPSNKRNRCISFPFPSFLRRNYSEACLPHCFQNFLIEFNFSYLPWLTIAPDINCFTFLFVSCPLLVLSAPL